LGDSPAATPTAHLLSETCTSAAFTTALYSKTCTHTDSARRKSSSSAIVIAFEKVVG
jgi:hypothetical protein